MPWSELNAAQRIQLGTFFREDVLPVLTPLAVDSSRPFPLLSSLSINLVLRLEGTGEAPSRFALVQIPAGLARLVKIAEPAAFVPLEEIVRAHLGELFPGQRILESAVIRLSRDAELELDDEGGRTQLEIVERQLRRRRRGGVTRLEITEGASEELLAHLRTELDINQDDVYVVPGLLDLRVLMQLGDLPALAAHAAPSLPPVDPLSIAQHADLFSVLDERDLLLHHPYEVYDPVVALVAQAADDPNVLAIKQTLYRTSVGSPIIAALQRAAERNKQVTVLVELTARFDEERNIHWARALEEAGAHVIYGVHGYKTHAKICLVVRRRPEGLRRYVHLGTGNYNERTARIYTDFSLLTTSRAIAEDASAFFSAITGYSDPPRLKKLVMAPTGLRRRFEQLIERERRRAEAGQPAAIVAKMNSLTDEDIIARALRRVAERGDHPAQHPRDLRAAAGRSRSQRAHRGGVDRGPLPRARAHLSLPQRRRRRGLPGERRLDDAQPRQAPRADVPGRGPRAQGARAARAALDVPRHGQGPMAPARRHVRPPARRVRRAALPCSAVAAGRRRARGPSRPGACRCRVSTGARLSQCRVPSAS